jgi:hypothetical protein
MSDITYLFQELQKAKDKELIFAVHRFTDSPQLGDYVAVIFPERIPLDRIETVKIYIQNRYKGIKILPFSACNRTIYIQILGIY